jgi:uncharacterized protein YjeT (DUF2065 family)
LFSAVVFAGTGLGYLIAPGAMLAVVGDAFAATSDFLLRTEGVALLCGAGLLWAVRDGTSAQLRVALIALEAYYILGSIVDIMAFRDEIVGFALVPSAAARTVVGAICFLTAARRPSQPQG